MVMNEYHNETDKYYWNFNAETEKWEEGQLTHTRITDDNNRYITLLNTQDCKNDEEVHFKMMESFGDYCLTKVEKTYVILKRLQLIFPTLHERIY